MTSRRAVVYRSAGSVMRSRAAALILSGDIVPLLRWPRPGAWPPHRGNHDGREEPTRGLCRSCPQALPPAPGRRSSDQADVAANWQDTPARRGVTTGMRGRRVEVRAASPEPAVGVSTPAGTCPGRLRRHYVCPSTACGCGIVYRRWNLTGLLAFVAAQVTVLLAAALIITWAHAWPGVGRFFTSLTAAGLTGLLAVLAAALLAGGYATIRRATA